MEIDNNDVIWQLPPQGQKLAVYIGPQGPEGPAGPQGPPGADGDGPGNGAQLIPTGQALPSAEAIEGGGIDLLGYTWPAWGHGGNSSDKNTYSPTLLDLDQFGVSQMMWIPGFAVGTLDNSIHTPYTTGKFSGNDGGGHAKIITWDLHWVTNEFDPIATQSNYYLINIVNMLWMYHDENGFLHFRARYATSGGSATTDCVSTTTIPIRDEMKLRVIFQPGGDNGTSPWTCDFLVKQEDGTYQAFGDRIQGDVQVTAYVEGNTSTPTTSVIIGQGTINSQMRGGLISVKMTHGTTVVSDVDFTAWTPNSATYTGIAGNVWTINNPMTDNWVTQTCLAIAPGEYITDNATSTQQFTSPTHGLYTTLSKTGFHWDASFQVALNAYKASNTIVNLLAAPVTQTVGVYLDESGQLIADATVLKTHIGTVATEYYANSVAVAARTGAVQAANDLVTSKIDNFTSGLTGGTSWRADEAISGAGAFRIYGSLQWESTQAIPAGLSPLSIGDGSSTDQNMVLSRADGHFAANGGTGGFGGIVRQVTTLADDSSGTTVGSFRYHLNAHEAAWKTDQTTASWITFDQVSDSACLAALDGNGYVNINLAADVAIRSRNLTIDGSGIKRGTLRLNPGGSPGPKPYGTTTTSVSSGTATPTFNVGGTIDVGGTKLGVGRLVDVGKYVTGVWTTYMTSATVKAFDKAAGTIQLNETTPVTVPSGAIIILATYKPGALGKALIVGGKDWNACYNPTNVVLDGLGRGVPPGNLIFREFAWTGNWGGDVIDTGDAKDVQFTNWCDTVWVDHCEFANPDPFHDVLFGVNSGGTGFTISWCKFHDHYKAINHFRGVDGSGGINPGGSYSPTHSFPPGYTADSPGPYRFAQPTTSLHGDSSINPITIGTATWHHNWFDRLGQRAVKTELYQEVHNFNNLHTNGGMADSGTVLIGGIATDTGVDTCVRFPPGDTEAIHTPVQTLIQTYSKYVGEYDIYIPHKNATGGALQGVKRAPVAGGKTGYMKLNNLWLETNTGASGPYTAEANYDPLGLVPDFSTRYSYTPIMDRNTLYNQVTAGAGAGTQRKMWQLVGAVSIPATIDVQKDGAEIGPGATLASSSTINFTGSAGTVTYNGGTRVTSVALPGNASSGTAGIVQLATNTEAQTGTNTTKAVTPAGLAAATTGFQPVDSDLTAIAALATTSFGRAFLTLADASASRTYLGVDAAGANQPLDSDLTAIAALSTTSYGRSFLALADATAGRTLLGLGSAALSASSAFDASGAAAAAQAAAIAASQPVDSDLTAIAALTTTTIGRSLLAAADAAALRTILALGTAATQASTAFDSAGAASAAQAAAIAASQPLDATLTALAGLATGADKMPYSTGTDTFSQTTITSFMRGVMAAVDASAAKTALSVADSAPLAMVRYQPTTGQTDASISTTAGDITAAAITAAWTGIVASSLDLTFNVPASRKVIIEVEALTKGSASGTVTRFLFADPTAAVTYTNVQSTLIAGTTQIRSRYKMLVDFSGTNATVTAGTSVTIRPQMVAGSTGTIAVSVGGTNGPVMATAYAA